MRARGCRRHVASRHVAVLRSLRTGSSRKCALCASTLTRDSRQRCACMARIGPVTVRMMRVSYCAAAASGGAWRSRASRVSSVFLCAEACVNVFCFSSAQGQSGRHCAALLVSDGAYHPSRSSAAIARQLPSGIVLPESGNVNAFMRGGTCGGVRRVHRCACCAYLAVNVVAGWRYFC